MTREEAFTILNLPESSSMETIQAQYNELYSDYRIRLTNAPTPNLKKLYQKNLQDLDTACNHLLSSYSAQNKDLPSASPVYEMQSANTQRATVQQYPAEGSSIHPKKKTGNSSYSWIIMTLAVSTIAAYLGILWVQTMDKLTVAQGKAEKFHMIEPLITNKKFKISNTGTESFRIVAYCVVYRDNKGEFVKHEGQWKEEIRPGSTTDFEVIEMNTPVWEGDVIYYSIYAENKDRLAFFSGLWAKDTKDGVLKVNLDDARK